MAKKKVAAIVKIQIPAGAGHAGAARRHRARPARRGDHGLLQGVQRRRPRPAGHDRPRRDHDLRGPLVHVRPQDAADAGAAACRPPASRRASQTPGTRRSRHDHRGAGRPRSPRSRCPTSTPTTSRRPRSRSPAPPARWASRSASIATSRPGGPRPAARHRGSQHGDTARSTPTRPSVRPRAAAHAGRGGRPGEEPGHGQVRRDRRARRAPRRRSPQGRPDGARHRRPARRAPARTSGSRCSPPATPPPRPRGRRRRHRRRRRPRRRRSRAACSTSTSPSPRPT